MIAIASRIVDRFEVAMREAVAVPIVRADRIAEGEDRAAARDDGRIVVHKRDCIVDGRHVSLAPAARW